jgi:hypothetical protein
LCQSTICILTFSKSRFWGLESLIDIWAEYASVILSLEKSQEQHFDKRKFRCLSQNSRVEIEKLFSRLNKCCVWIKRTAGAMGVTCAKVAADLEGMRVEEGWTISTVADR